jgi:DNA processing protein
MAALSRATVIVEAGETSGTLAQARAALKQGRKLFILDSNFRNPALSWPARFLEQGAVRVSEYDEIRERLAKPSHKNGRSRSSGPQVPGG